MEPLEEKVRSQLEETQPGSAVSLVTDLSGYFDALKGFVGYASAAGLHTIYITATIPSAVVHGQLTSQGLNLEDAHFIDCISFMVGGPRQEEGPYMFVESPTMLETILVKVELWMKRLGPDHDYVVFLDSVNTLAMHNDDKIVQEFLHYLITSLRARKVRCVVLSVEGQTPKEIETILKLLCDESIAALPEAEDGASE